LRSKVAGDFVQKYCSIDNVVTEARNIFKDLEEMDDGLSELIKKGFCKLC